MSVRDAKKNKQSRRARGPGWRTAAPLAGFCGKPFNIRRRATNKETGYQQVACRARRRFASASNPTENLWMSFHQCLQAVSCELQEILWMDVPRKPGGGECDRLEAELRRAAAALFQVRRSMDELGRRLTEKEQQAQWLKARV